jgi:hypothetical protein
MSRVLSRPMFRRGGSANGGITSGLRQGYVTGGYTFPDVLPTKKEYGLFEDILGPRAPDSSLNDFLMNWGVNLVGNAPSGNILQTAATEAKEPLQRFQAQKALEEQGGRQEKADILGAIMGAKSEMLAGEGQGTVFAKQVDAQEISNNMKELSTLITNQQGENKLSDAQFKLDKSILMQNLQKFTGGYPAVDALYKNVGMVEQRILGIQSRLINDPNEITFTDENGIEQTMAASQYYTTYPDKLAAKTQTVFLQNYNNALLEAMGISTAKATGGRVGYQTGKLVDEQVSEVEETPQGIRAFSENIEEEVPASNELSFEELRGRLPPEVTDDIINLIVQSPSALVDFAEVQTQSDVDNFNAKYGVNLVLPSEA